MRLIPFLLAILAVQAHADTEIELGPTFLAQEFAHAGTLILTERVAGKYDFTIGHIMQQLVQTCDRVDCIQRIDRNLYFGVGRFWQWQRVEFGISGNYFGDTSRVSGAHLMVGVMLGYRFCESISLRVRHYSNAGHSTRLARDGTQGYNLGQDAITLAVRFR